MKTFRAVQVLQDDYAFCCLKGLFLLTRFLGKNLSSAAQYESIRNRSRELIRSDFQSRLDAVAATLKVVKASAVNF